MIQELSLLLPFVSDIWKDLINKIYVSLFNYVVFMGEKFKKIRC